MLEPGNANATPCNGDYDPSKVYNWNPNHARPTMTTYKNDWQPSIPKPLARLIGVTGKFGLNLDEFKSRDR